MPITLDDVNDALAIQPEEVAGRYNDRDSLLYAVAIGMGKDPLDESELSMCAKPWAIVSCRPRPPCCPALIERRAPAHPS